MEGLKVNLSISNFNEAMKRFLKKCFYVSLPFWAIVLLYIVLDPFKVVRHYDSFFEEGDCVELNQDYVSTVMYDRQRARCGYNSFILGNSRSRNYEVNYWKDCLGGEDVSCYHFDASNESLYGLTSKVEYIDRQGDEIKNMLLVIDSQVLSAAESRTGHLYHPAPQFTDDCGLSFQLSSFNAFCTLRFIYSLIYYKMTGEIKPYMIDEGLLRKHSFQYAPESNEATESLYEQQIAEGLFYDEQRMRAFDVKVYPGRVEEPVIQEPQKSLLMRCRRVFDKHGTCYKIVINPLFDQVRLNPADLHILQQIFGEGNVFDYSGSNRFTTDYHNYYESSHYRPCVAREIMSEIYTLTDTLFCR